jgi:tRNA pseudouridine55 synthase
VDGILNINKPPGVTSFGVVAIIRRLSGERRVGHTGTLDPDATGVLPVCLGRGTRIIEFLTDTDKTYRAGIVLGVATDTYDSSGSITRQGDPSDVDRLLLESTLDSFRGVIRQTPPMYSAIKHKGKPLYHLARSGITIERKSRTVHIHRLELVDWKSPVATLEIECSKGTYIRSLANDLGDSLGCGAHLANLIRIRSGDFHIEESVSLAKLEGAFRNGYWERYLYPVDAVLQDYQAIVVDEVGEHAIKQGSPLKLDLDIDSDAITGVSYCRAYSMDGRFLGMLQYIPDKSVWQPKKVFV